MAAAIEDLRVLGEPVQAMLEWVGATWAWFLLAGAVKAIVSRPFEGAEFLRQLDAIGAKSLPPAARWQGRHGQPFSPFKPATVLHGLEPSLCCPP